MDYGSYRGYIGIMEKENGSHEAQSPKALFLTQGLEPETVFT